MNNKIVLFKFMDIYGKCYLVAPSEFQSVFSRNDMVSESYIKLKSIDDVCIVKKPNEDIEASLASADVEIRSL